MATRLEDMPGALALGAWEKAMLLEHLRDDSHCINWLVELERPLDPQQVCDALDLLRPAFPLHFARVRSAEDGLGVVALTEQERPIHEFLVHHARFEGGGRAYARVLANTRLEPLSSGLFRCHCITGPTPMLAFQVAHVAGDGYTNYRFRMAFAEVLGALARGQRPELERPLGAHAVSLEEVLRLLPMDPRALEDIVRRATRLRLPRMTVAVEPGQDGQHSQRLFRARVEPERYARLVARASTLGLTPLALLGAALALAVRETFDAIEQGRGDFFALSVPRDLRGPLGRQSQLGNLIYPQGVPIFGEDPLELEPMAAVFFERMQRGRMNRLMYRHFSQLLRETQTLPVAARPGGRVRAEADRLVLEPLPILGVTEIPRWGSLEGLAGARIQQTFFQTPMMTRRFEDGQVQLGCTLHWHPAFEHRIHALLESFLRHLFGAQPVAWELL